MRAAAILLVLIGHCSYFLPEEDSLLKQLLSVFGFFGVEIFFVLSGFLIGKILLQMFEANLTLQSVMLFLKRRWFRTLPNYYLTLIINLFIAAYIGYEVASEWRYFIFMQNWASPLLPFFPESWSLSVEEWAYVLLPITLLFIARFSNQTSRFVLTVVLLILMVQIFKFIYHFNNPSTTLIEWNIGLKSVVIYRLDAIFAGVLMSVVYVKRNAWWTKIRYFASFLGVLLAMALFVGVGYFRFLINDYALFWNVLYLPLASLIAVLFLPLLSEWKSAPKLLSKPITVVSVLSYSMYLLHYSIVLQLMRHHFDLSDATTTTYVVFTAIYFSVTFMASYVLYRFYEKPITDLRETAGLANLERFFPLSRFYKKR